MAVFDGVVDFCLEHKGTQAFLIPVRNGTRPDSELLSKVHGVVTWGAHIDTWIVDLWKAGMPLVNCNHAFVHQVPTVSPGRLHHVAYDYLSGLGRKCIGYVTSTQIEGCPQGVERLREMAERDHLEWRLFEDVRVDPGMHPEHIVTGNDEAELEKFLLSLPKPAALWCVHDEMAALVWLKAQSLGINVPHELALLGQGDHPCAIHSTLGITTVKPPSTQLGISAARLIYQHLQGLTSLTGDTWLPTDPATIIERASTGGSNPINHAVQKAWRLLENYPQEGITVERLIQETKISRISFYKYFLDAFGISPGKAIRISRLKKAKECLFSSDMPIAQVGSLCGFSSESDFSNFFKRETGQTPREWRKSSNPSFLIRDPATGPIPSAKQPVDGSDGTSSGIHEAKGFHSPHPPKMGGGEMVSYRIDSPRVAPIFR